MTNAEKYKAYTILNKYTDKIFQALYEQQKLELDEILEIEDTLKKLKDDLWLEVLKSD